MRSRSLTSKCKGKSATSIVDRGANDEIACVDGMPAQIADPVGSPADVVAATDGPGIGLFTDPSGRIASHPQEQAVDRRQERDPGTVAIPELETEARALVRALSPRQRQIMSYLIRRHRKGQPWPTWREIQDTLQIRSVRFLRDSFHRLVVRGYLVDCPGERGGMALAPGLLGSHRFDLLLHPVPRRRLRRARDKSSIT